MATKPYLLHALSPLHAGTGQAVDVIDLPIARMRATRIPYVPGSSVKGVLRWVRRPPAGLQKDDFFSTFGPETENASDHAGALSVSDARLLLLPVRSFVGTFAYVTSPMLLNLATRDLKEAGMTAPALPAPGDFPMALSAEKPLNPHNNRVYLEDLDLPTKVDDAVSRWAETLASLISPDAAALVHRRFLVVDDQTMSFLWDTATQVDARIRLDPGTRTVVDGALWYEESLPPETVLIGLMMATGGMRSTGKDQDKKHHSWTADQSLSLALPSEEILQFGGKASVGRGRCRVIPVTLSSTKEADHG